MWEQAYDWQQTGACVEAGIVCRPLRTFTIAEESTSEQLKKRKDTCQQKAAVAFSARIVIDELGQISASGRRCTGRYTCKQLLLLVRHMITATFRGLFQQEACSSMLL